MKQLDLNELVPRLKQRQLYTPDFNTLSLHNEHLVLIYDTIKKTNSKEKNALYLSKAKYLGKTVTIADRFILKKSKSNATIVALERYNNSLKGCITGELYSVDLETLEALDVFYSNENICKRSKVYATALDQSYVYKQNRMEHPVITCFMYLGLPQLFTDSNLNQFSYCDRYKTDKDSSYHWSYSDWSKVG